MGFPTHYKDASVTTKEHEDKFVIEMSRLSALDADRKMNTVSSFSYPAGAKEIIEKNVDDWLELLYKNLREREKTVKENW